MGPLGPNGRAPLLKFLTWSPGSANAGLPTPPLLRFSRLNAREGLLANHTASPVENASAASRSSIETLSSPYLPRLPGRAAG